MSLSIRSLARVACAAAVAGSLALPAFAQSDSPPPPPPSPPAAQEDDEAEANLAEPDFSLVALPTTHPLPRYGLNFRLTHRFLANLRSGTFTGHLENLFGLDNGAVIGLEVRFAPIRRLQINVHRSSQDKTLMFQGQYDAIRQGDRFPVSISGILSVEGTNNFRAREIVDDGHADHDHDVGGGGAHRSPAIGAVVSRMVGDRLALYAVPMWVGHSADLAGGDRNTAFLGLGGRGRLSRNVFVVAEVSPRIAGYAPGSAQYAFGIERKAGGHTFLLTFTNSVATTFGQISQGGFPDTLYLGFNLGRKFF
jgi:hypothetical protein